MHALRALGLGLALALFQTAAADDHQIVLQNASVIDVETGQVSRNQSVLIENDRIAAIGSRISADAGADLIDLQGAYLLPGLSDSHVHLTSRADRHGSSCPPDEPRRPAWFAPLPVTSW